MPQRNRLSVMLELFARRKGIFGNIVTSVGRDANFINISGKGT